MLSGAAGPEQMLERALPARHRTLRGRLDGPALAFQPSHDSGQRFGARGRVTHHPALADAIGSDLELRLDQGDQVRADPPGSASLGPVALEAGDGLGPAHGRYVVLPEADAREQQRDHLGG